MADFENALRVLEFDKIRTMLASLSSTEGAKARALRLMPETSPDHIKLRLSQTTEAKKLSAAKGSPSFYGVRDVTGALDRACKGAALSPRELLDIAAVLSCARNLCDYNNIDNRESRNSLDMYFERLSSDRSLENAITRAIESEDMISDAASTALADIRRKMRAANARIKESLQKYITSGAYTKYLQENIITMRDGRYVIPVRAECKNEVKGLVHDTSASGATLFVEPASVVEANNDLRILENEEKKEIDKILSDLSLLCAAQSDMIASDYYNITELSFAFAKAELSYKMKANEPQISGKKALRLDRARHPLLDQSKVVPTNVRLGGDFDVLVITGPNTGGKTVTLKTIGLLCAMAQAGLHIPADDSSFVPVFESIYADIGDEQSIEQSLSTFSAHMTNIVSFIHTVDDKSLVLFDELGAGTDPIEGAALAMSILERTMESGALCAATTHYAELKAFALQTEGVCNASCEFNVETLAPTYRLIIGTPGKSNAFAISEKLGLGEDIVERARAHVSGDDRKFELVIEQLEESRLQMERYRDEAARSRDEFEAFRAESEKKIRAEREASEKELDRAKREAYRIVKGAKASSEYVLEQLEKAKKELETENARKAIEDARRAVRGELSEADDRIDPVVVISNDDYVLPRPLKKGDTVLIVNINRQGTLVDDPDKSGNVQVKAGSMTTRTKVKNLRLVEESEVKQEKKRANETRLEASLHKSFSPELDLRGQLGDDAWFATDKYIDDAMMLRIPTVRIIHGKGTGALRKRLWDELKGDRRVKSMRLGVYGEGDTGVTVLELKV